MWNETPFEPIWSPGRRTGAEAACGVGIRGMQPTSDCWQPGLFNDLQVGWNMSTGRRRTPNYRPCDKAWFAVVRTGTSVGPNEWSNDWAWKVHSALRAAQKRRITDPDTILTPFLLHPNIARFFEAGVNDNGHPYFVMELVKGRPMTKYCLQH